MEIARKRAPFFSVDVFNDSPLAYCMYSIINHHIPVTRLAPAHTYDSHTHKRDSRETKRQTSISAVLFGMALKDMRKIRQYYVVALLLCIWCCCHATADGYSYYESLSVCSDTSIDVTGVSILCDTPGVWYYGSNGYRNSKTCHKGDKATLQVTFDIIDEELTEESDIYFSLSVYGGDQEITVYKNAHLCSIGILTATTSGVTCPYQGSFSIKTKLYFAKDTNNVDDDANRYSLDDDTDGTTSSSSTSPAFSPLVTVGFASNPNSGYYDMGGANTVLCGGQSKNIQSDITTTVTSALSSRSFTTFLLTFGVIIATIAMLAGTVFFVWNKRVCDRACFPPEKSFMYDLESDTIDFSERKMELMARQTAMMTL